VLEVGTGSGYQTAALSLIAGAVYSMEITAELAGEAQARLAGLGYRVHVRAGDGVEGWPTAAPFDAILIAAAAPEIPLQLAEQLVMGGRMVVPVGDVEQTLVVGEKRPQGLVHRAVSAVRFVPMTGRVRGSGDDDQ
jgi:protein-L-isoaspartate(D-aspartate) O-methyltransferase